MARNLLSPMVSNAKTAKEHDARRLVGRILYLSPHTVATELSVCPDSTPGCRESCLYRSGRGGMTSVDQARQSRTRRFWANRTQFLVDLDRELGNLARLAKRTDRTAVCRLNGTSDLAWETFGPSDDQVAAWWGQVSILERHPTVRFYDYTKSKRRALRFAGSDLYSLTYSRSERDADADLVDLVDQGVNVAAVFRSTIPETWLGRPVIDGTRHDFRFQDPRGVFVGLRAGGPARRDASGFVIDL